MFHINFYHILLSFVLAFTAIDIYTIFILIRQKRNNKITKSFKTPYSLFIAYLAITVVFTLFAFIYPFWGGLPDLNGDKMRTYFTLFGLLFLFQIPKFIYQLFWLIGKTFAVLALKLKSIILKSGLVISGILFVLIAYGMIWGKTDYKVSHVSLYFDNLPKAFDGFKILQISDIHLGSFYNKKEVQKAVDLIKKQNTDLIVFTGDLINVVSYEALDYVNMFSDIKAPYGKYSILGNHDLNDYRKIDKIKGGWKNTENVIILNEAMGFHMLNNQHVFLINNKDTIALIGVENWGKPPFKKYGNLPLAMKGVEKAKFKILLSHDPSHWGREVLPKTNIDLTLSGHTHGFQMGINSQFSILNSQFLLKWSPVSHFYSHWLGLYENNKRYLYVNAGLGFIGIPARIGICPEITVIELRRKNY